MTKQVRADGVTKYYEGVSGQERVVRVVSPQGEATCFTGDAGKERLVTRESPQTRSVEFELVDDEARNDVLKWASQVTMHERGIMTVQAVCAAHDLSRGVNPHRVSEDTVRFAENLTALEKREFKDSFMANSTKKSFKLGKLLNVAAAKRCAETLYGNMQVDEIANTLSAYQAVRKRAKKSSTDMVAHLNQFMQKHEAYARDLERMVQIENELDAKVSHARQSAKDALERGIGENMYV
jgi:hypothetical protein